MRPKLALASLCSAFVLAGQTPQEAAPLRVSVTLVQVDAIVTDGSGRHVTDLTADDFEILQDGVPQKVTRSAYIRVAPEAAEAPKGPLPQKREDPDHVKRSIAIVVDDLGLAFDRVPEVRRALHKFIDEQMRPGDLVAILCTGRNIGALHQFTTDKRKLHAAAENIRSNFSSRTGVSGVGFPGGECSPEALIDGVSGTGSIMPVRGFAMGGTEVESMDRLAYVVGSLRELPGRKSVLLFAQTNILPLGSAGNRGKGAPPALLAAINNLLDQATRASTAIYTIDSCAELGVSPKEFDVDTASGDGGRIQSLIFLANSTGGKYVGGLSSDLTVPMAQAMEDQKGYYLLAYSPDPTTFEGPGKERIFHKIQVKVKRHGLQARSNAGFLGSPDEPPRRVLAHGLIKALNSPFGSSDIEAGVAAVFFDGVSGPSINALVNVKAGDLTLSGGPEERSTQGELAIAVFGNNGDAVYTNAVVFNARLRGADYERAMANGFLFTFRIPMKQAGPYDVRVAVLDKASGKIGSASSFIELPQLRKDRVSLSGILLQAPAPSAKGGGPDFRGSSALRVFHPGDTLDYAYQVLNPAVDKKSHAPKLEAKVSIFSAGKPVFEGKPAPVMAAEDPKRVAAGGSLKLGPEIKPGDYILQVDVKDLASDVKDGGATSSYMDFYVR